MLALAMSAAVPYLLWETRGETLLFDEWSFFADYRGWSPDVLLNPFSGNLELIPLILYKGIFELFGPGSVTLRLLMTALNLTCASLFFLLARGRVGDWVALAATVLIVLLGAAADIVAATLGIAIMTSVAFGLGALVALERRGPRSGLLPCLLLTGAIASNSVGLPFLAGAGVDVLLSGRSRRIERIWVVAVPLVLYGAWRLYALHLDPLGPLAAHPTEVTLTNIGTLPTSVADSLAAAVVSISGQFRLLGASGVGPNYAFGPSLAVALLAGIGWRLWRGSTPNPRLLVYAAMPLTYWILIALVVSDRLPGITRYQYAGSIFVLLLLFELAAGLRLPRWAGPAVVSAFVIALLPNVLNLHDGSNFLRVNGQQNRAQLAALEIVGDQVGDSEVIEPRGAMLAETSPGFTMSNLGEGTTDMVISAQRYLDAAERYGSPAFTESELAAARPYLREGADRELAYLLGVALRPAPAMAPPPGRAAPAVEAEPGVSPPAAAARGGCVVASAPGAPNHLNLQVPPGGISIEAAPGPPLAVSLRRFADSFPVDLGTLPGGSSGVLRTPADGSAAPWHVQFEYAQRVRACAVPG